jgi:hypothetical protein
MIMEYILVQSRIPQHFPGGQPYFAMVESLQSERRRNKNDKKLF